MKHRKSAFAVIASTAAEMRNDTELATYTCSSCGSAPFAVNASITPFCVHCGSDAVEKVDVSPDKLPKDDELSAIICPDCGTHNIMSDTSAAALAGVMSCVVCGSEISYDTSPLVASDDIDIEVDDEDEDEDEDTFGDLEEELEDEEEASDDGFEEEEAPIIATKSKSLVDLVSASTDDKGSVVRLTDSTILAFVGDVCVARLDKNDKNKHHEIFDHDSYIQSIATSIDENGLDKTLEEFDFNVTTVDVDPEQLKLHETEKAVQTAKAAVMEQASTLREEMRQCLSIAAVGLNKGFWKDATHELKAALYSEMQTAGIRNPASIIDKVFASTSDEHHSTLFEVAFDLLDKPVDVRNSLAEAVGNVNYTPVAETAGSTDEEFADKRLEQSLRTKRAEASVATDIPKGRLFAISN